jgi:ribosome recycling factor
MLNLIEQTEKRFQKTIQALQDYLSVHLSLRIRQEVLTPLFIEDNHIKVPLTHVVKITLIDGQTISLQPWDKSLVVKIEKEIRHAQLPFNITLGANHIIYLKLPLMTKERREDLCKGAKQQGESAKIALRNIRQDAKDILHTQKKEKLLSKEEEQLYEKRLQELVDKFNTMIHALVAVKQKELNHF